MKRIFIISIFTLLALGALFGYQYFTFHDGKLHVVFCNVGQGDGILIVTPSGKQILVDAGPDKAILSCLSKYMPFWDRTIDVALLTHPHADHFAGYYYVIDRYRIDHFSTEALRNNTDGFAELEKRLQKRNLPISFVSTGDRWRIGDGVVIEIAGPENTFLVAKDPDGVITSSAESGSLAMTVTYGDFSVFLTGDAPIDEMTDIALDGILGLDVLQIPHHGSDTGIDREVLSLLSPQMAVISVGKNNYGHPKKEVLDLLQSQGIKVLRTDQEGDLEVVSDGAIFEIK